MDQLAYLHAAFKNAHFSHFHRDTYSSHIWAWFSNLLPRFHPIHDVIKWKHFPRYSPFVRGISRSTVNSPQKGQWRGALTFSLICALIKGWVNKCEAGDSRRHRAHCDVIVICWQNGIINTKFVDYLSLNENAFARCQSPVGYPARQQYQ